MASAKKEQERAELHRAIWAIADELRGAVAGVLKNRIDKRMVKQKIKEGGLCQMI